MLDHMEQELPTPPEHLGSPQIFSGVHVAQCLVFGVMFCRWCSSSICGLWSPLWYLQTFLRDLSHCFKL